MSVSVSNPRITDPHRAITCSTPFHPVLGRRTLLTAFQFTRSVQDAVFVDFYRVDRAELRILDPDLSFVFEGAHQRLCKNLQISP